MTTPGYPSNYDVSVYPLGQSGPLGSDQWFEWDVDAAQTVTFIAGLAVKSLWFPYPQGPMSFYAGDTATGTPFYETPGVVAELVPVPNDAPQVTVAFTGSGTPTLYFYASSISFPPYSAGTPPEIIVGVTLPIVNTGTDTAPIIGLATPLAVEYGGSGSPDPTLIAGANVTISGSWPDQTISVAQAAGGVQSVGAEAPIILTGSAQNPVVGLDTPLAIGYGGTGSTDPYAKGGTGIEVNGGSGEDSTFQWLFTNTGVLQLKPGLLTGDIEFTSEDDSIAITNPGGGQTIDFSVQFPNAPKTVYGAFASVSGTNPTATLNLGPLPAGTWLLETYCAGLEATEGTGSETAEVSLSTGAHGGFDGSQYTRVPAAADTITSGGAATPSATLTCAGGTGINTHASSGMFVFKATRISS